MPASGVGIGCLWADRGMFWRVARLRCGVGIGCLRADCGGITFHGLRHTGVGIGCLRPTARGQSIRKSVRAIRTATGRKPKTPAPSDAGVRWQERNP